MFKIYNMTMRSVQTLQSLTYLFFEIEGSKEKVKKEKIKWESDEACKKLKELVSTFFK